MKYKLEYDKDVPVGGLTYRLHIHNSGGRLQIIIKINDDTYIHNVDRNRIGFNNYSTNRKLVDDIIDKHLIEYRKQKLQKLQNLNEI